MTLYLVHTQGMSQDFDALETAADQHSTTYVSHLSSLRLAICLCLTLPLLVLLSLDNSLGGGGGDATGPSDTAMGDGSGVTGAGGGAGVSAAERALAPKEALESVSPLLITVFGANVHKVACPCHATAPSLTPLAKRTRSCNACCRAPGRCERRL